MSLKKPDVIVIFLSLGPRTEISEAYELNILDSTDQTYLKVATQKLQQSLEKRWDPN